MEKIKLLAQLMLMKAMSWIRPYKAIATVFVMRDEPTHQVDTVFFFGRTSTDQTPELFEHCVRLYTTKRANSILINGIEKEKFGHTKTAWTERLTAMSIPGTAILSFPPSENTTEEAKQMILFAKEKRWKSATILAHPHQIVRCLRALIWAMEIEQYWMKIYCSPPRCDFFEITTGSQNLFPAERWRHIAIEYSGLQRFFFPLASFKQVIEYYARRKNIA